MNHTKNEPKQKRSKEMKKLILKESLFLFCERGYYNVTTNEIAKKAGISIGSLYFHFHDKKNILLILLEEYNTNFLYVFEEFDTQINIDLFEKDKKSWLRKLIVLLVDLHKNSSDFSKELNALYLTIPEVKTVIDHQQNKVYDLTYERVEHRNKELHLQDAEATSIVFLDFLSALVDRISMKENYIDEERILETGINGLYLLINNFDTPANKL